MLILTPLKSLTILLKKLNLIKEKAKTLIAPLSLVDKDTSLLFTKGNNRTLSKGKESNST